jgi:putative MATE family efflux protein
MLTGSPLKALVRYSVPILISDFFMAFYNIADTFIVGRLLGMEALAAVGSTRSLYVFIYGFAIGLCNGVTIVLAQRYGKMKNEEAEGKADRKPVERSAATCLCITIAFAFLSTAVFLPLVSPVLRWMQTPADIIGMAGDYVIVIFRFMAITFFGNILNSFLYAIGNSRTPLVIMLAASLLNIALDILFIGPLGRGVAGAAEATVLSQVFSLIAVFIYIYRKHREFLPSLKVIFRPSIAELKAHLPLGLTMGLQQSIIEVGNIFVQAATNSLGTVAVAAVSTAQRIRQINMMPFFSLMRGVATFTAQNYGAGLSSRVKSGLRSACLLGVGISLLMGAANFIWGEAASAVFLGSGPLSGDALAAARLSAEYLRYTGAFLFLLTLMLNFRAATQGLGKSVAPTVCSIMETVMSLAAAFILIPAFGFSGACIANPLSWFASCIPVLISWLRFAGRKHASNSDA